VDESICRLAKSGECGFADFELVRRLLPRGASDTP
jgi:hypothetical protein